MKHERSLSATCFAVAVMLILSISVHPTMAAEAINEETGYCASCSGGIRDYSSQPGFENRTMPRVVIREIAPKPATLSSNGLGGPGHIATVVGARKHHTSSGMTLDIIDPFSGNIATAIPRMAGADAGVADDQITAVTVNMSHEGYDLTAESSHRYESTVTTDDFLSLNSSQKAELAREGFSMIAGDTVQSYRDVTYLTFTNRSTQSRIYVMAVQRLDADGKTTGGRELAFSPEFSLSGTPVSVSSYGAPAVSGKSCTIEWIAFVLAAIGLIINIVVIVAASSGWHAAIIGHNIANIIANFWYVQGRANGGREFADVVMGYRSLFIVLAVATGIILLFILVYSIERLGICIGWWDALDEPVWTYQYRFTDFDNGKRVSLDANTRFALALFSDTRADTDAYWTPESSTGILIQDTLTAKTDNGTIQSWLFVATEPGPHELVMKYITDKSLPATIAGTRYTLTLNVEGRKWDIRTVDAAKKNDGTGQYNSLAIDHAGIPHISYYDAAKDRIMYARLDGTTWSYEKVADSKGTYTTSLALDADGNPAISFGDGLHYGNLKYATRNGTTWDAATVDNGSAGDAGQYSSLVLDAAGTPHIMYNDGQYFATLKYTLWNGSAWEISSVDNAGVAGNTGFDSSLVLDTAGIPHVSYRDGTHYANLMYATNNGDGWTTTVVDRGNASTGNTGYYTSLTLDSRKNPHIAYYDAKNTHLRYASWNGSGWVLETIDRAGDVGQFASLAIDSRDRPHIGYYDASNHELRYATRDTGSVDWVIRTVDTDGDVGQYAKIALDPSGQPCFSYYDATNHALKYAGWIG